MRAAIPGRLGESKLESVTLGVGLSDIRRDRTDVAEQLCTSGVIALACATKSIGTGSSAAIRGKALKVRAPATAPRSPA